MNDMSAVIIPKSDQINADDLIAGPRTYQIESVEVRPGTEQPVNIRLVGEDRAWRPCKSMSRVLVAAWGPNSKDYTGRSLTLYRDPKVKWGGMEIGGIRVSHMTHIERDMLLQLTATKGKRAPHVVKPLTHAPAGKGDQNDGALTYANGFIKLLDEKITLELLDEFANSKAKKLDELRQARPELHERCMDALAARRAALSPNDGTFDPDENPTAAEGPADEQRGDQFDDDYPGFGGDA